MRFALVVIIGLLSACSKKSATPADAGTTQSAAAKGTVSRSTDLRSVLLLVYPEYRGTNLVSARARLSRTLSGEKDWTSLAHALFAKNKVTEKPDDGGVAGSFDLFELRVVPGPKSATSTIDLPIDGDTLGRLYTNPASLSSAQLGLWLPKEGVTISREVFDFDLVYDAVSENRASFVTRQLVDLLLGNSQWTVDGELPEGWEPSPPDGGRGGVPATFSVSLTGVVDGAKVKVTRAGRRVTVGYTLATLEP
jgi:hypothetical protein